MDTRDNTDTALFCSRAIYFFVQLFNVCTRWSDDVVSARQRLLQRATWGTTCSILSMRLGREEVISTTYGALTSKAGLHDPVGNTPRTLDPLQLSQQLLVVCDYP